jgi:hypothetical protein
MKKVASKNKASTANERTKTCLPEVGYEYDYEAAKFETIIQLLHSLRDEIKACRLVIHDEA